MHGVQTSDARAWLTCAVAYVLSVRAASQILIEQRKEEAERRERELEQEEKERKAKEEAERKKEEERKRREEQARREMVRPWGRAGRRGRTCALAGPPAWCVVVCEVCGPCALQERVEREREEMEQQQLQALAAQRNIKVGRPQGGHLCRQCTAGRGSARCGEGSAPVAAPVWDVS
jgi:hypothetical protein